MTKRRVVITGVGAVTPYGMGADSILRGWNAGEVAIEDGEAHCSDFQATDALSRKERQRSDRFTQLGLVAGMEAAQGAGWEDDLPCDPDRIGVIMGTGFGGIHTSDAQHDVIREEGPRRVSPLSIPMMMGNAACAALALHYGLHGPNFQAGSACAAGATAIGSAMRSIQTGDADACLAGGAEAPFTPFSRAGFRVMGATSPSGHCRPFDARRDGFVMGEGAAVLALEAADVAEARGAPILGELLGYGATADGFHLTMPEPGGRSAARAITRALEDAGVGPEDVDYVNAHGTATPLNDAAETQAIKTALGEDVARRVPVSSIKSGFGHLIGAAGAVEAVALLLSLREGVAPPTLNYGEQDPDCDLDYVTDGPRPLVAKGNGGGERAIGISNSFGFGGHNVVLCLAA